MKATQKFYEEYEKLNPEQKEAVDHIDGPLICLAGPGTGKTQIIAMRIAKILLDTQMEPYNVLCLTFTESGAVAMRKRLVEIIGTAAYYVHIHTFHSFCNEIIKENYEKFVFARELEPLSDIERVQIFKAIIDELPISSSIKPYGDIYFYWRDLVKAVQELKREEIDESEYKKILSDIETFISKYDSEITDFIETHGSKLEESQLTKLYEVMDDSVTARHIKNIFEEYFKDPDKKKRTATKNQIKDFYGDLKSDLPKQKEIAKVYEEYQIRIREKGRYDYEDMILFVVEKFKQDPELLAKYQERYQYILIDEYQDTNGAQNETVKILLQYFEVPNIFVVGDDKQSIYRFQGASLENILFFYKQYRDNVKIVSLRHNYRSYQYILDAAHSLIQYNENSLEKIIESLQRDLRAFRGNTEQKIEVLEFENTLTENYSVAKKIKELISSGVKPSEIAVLYRENRDAIPFADTFLQMEIPFRVETGKNILEDPTIKLLIELLRFICNFELSDSLYKVMFTDFFGFKKTDVAKLAFYAKKNRRELFEILSDEKAMAEANVGEVQKFTDFLNKILEWKSISVTKVFIQFFDQVLKESGLLNYLGSKPENLDDLNRMNTLFEEAKKLNRSNHNLSLEEFLKYIDDLNENGIQILEQPIRTSKDAVRLMTAHKSKGLEFEHVFITKCVHKHWGDNAKKSKLKLPKGLIQNDLLNDIKERNEDERRLFYVALTRAKNGLYISYPKLDDSGRPVTPSLFITEIDENLLERKILPELEDEAMERLQSMFLTPRSEPDLNYHDYLRTMVQGYKLSVSHLNNYLRCPRIFLFENLLGIKKIRSKHMSFGRAVHQALEDFFNEYRRKQLPQLEFLQDKFKFYLSKEILSTNDFRDSLDYGLEILKNYYEHYKNSFHKNSVVEYPMDAGVIVDGIPLVGRIDKIEILDEKNVRVVDFKTSNPDNKYEEMKKGGEYHRQILFYKLLCDNAPNFNYKMISGILDFLQPSKRKNDYVRAEVDLNEEDLNELKILIKDVYQDIKSLRFLTSEEMNYCGECEWCLAV